MWLNRTKRFAMDCEVAVKEIIEEMEDTLSLGCSPRLKMILEELLQTAKEAEFSIEFIKSIEEKSQALGTRVIMEMVDVETGEKTEEVIDMTIEDNKVIEWRNQLQKTITHIMGLLSDIEKLYEKREIEQPDGTIRRVLIEFKADTPPQSPNSALDELHKISQIARATQTQVPKDLIESQIRKPEESILDSSTEEDKEKLMKLQSKGKLLFGSVDGLSDGTPYFKVFSLVLSQILNEQSKYYNTEGDWSGVPTETISTLMGGEIQIQERDPVTIGGHTRPHPYVLVSYEELAKRMSKTGSISGGKDIEQVRQYIEEIQDKRYPVRVGKGQFIIVPYLVNEGDLIDINKTNPYVGCILRLSPQFSRTTRGYVGLPSDIIQRLGGGKQKAITIDLLEILAFNRGVGAEWKKKKTDLLSKYAESKNYKGRPGKLQKDFMESVVKIINTGLLLTGKDKKGNLNGYRESKNNGGEIVCHFFYNPDFLQGEEIGIPEEQTGK